MPAANKPQDHLEKKDKPKVEIIDGGKQITHKGIIVTVLDESIDDFELVDELSRIQFGGKEEAGRLPGICRRLVGDEGYKAIMDGLRGPNGRVPVRDGLQYIQELLVALNPNS